MRKTDDHIMIISLFVKNEKIFQFISQSFVKSRSEDMQSTAKCLAYLHHNVLQRGDYHS